MRNASQGENAEVFFRRQQDGGMAAERSAEVAMAPLSAETVLTFGMSENPNWNGTITQLRFDFTDSPTGQVEIAEFALLR
jgi:hypothetical protein